MRIKRFLATALMLCLLFVIVLPIESFADNEERTIVRVGYHTTYTDIIFNLDYRNNEGYGYEVFKKIEEISDFTFEFVPIYGSMVDALSEGIVDVGGLSVRTDDRRDEVIFSNTPYSKTYTALMTNDMSIRYNTPESIDGKRVATYEDNYAQQYLDIYCERNNISVEYVYGEIHNYRDLDADFYITYSEDKHSTLLNNVLNLGVFNLYLMAAPESQELLDQLDVHFYQIVTTEGNFFMELEEKYLSDNIEINHRSLTANEVEVLRQRPLEVGYIANFQPISFQNEDGLPDGAMIDIFDSFAERFGFSVNYHPYNLSDGEETHEDFDILLTLYGDNDHDEMYYDKTETFYDIPIYGLVHIDTHQKSVTYNDIVLNSPRIGTLPYQEIDFELLEKWYEDNDFIFFEDWHDLLDSFAAREVDMMICTDSGATYAELYLEDTETITELTNLEVPMKLLVSKEISNEYLPIFNVMLDLVDEGYYKEALMTNANVYYPEKGAVDYFTEYWYYYALAVFVLLAMFILYAYIKQKREKEAIAMAYNTDALTGFMEAHRFIQEVSKILETAEPNEYELISFDIDMFKTINTHYSNDRGTSVILAVSDSLSAFLRIHRLS